MNPELIELSETLGVAAEHLWAALIKQSLIWGWSYVAYYVVAGVALLVVWRRDLPEYWRELDDAESLFAVFARFTSLFFFLVPLTFDGSRVIGSLLNPEYWALQRVLDALN